MNRRLTLLIMFFALIICSAIPASVSAEAKLMSKQTDAYFSTVSALFLYDEPDQSDKFAQTWTQVKQILAEIESAVSLSFSDSDIARFNALLSGESMPISSITADILSIAFDAYRKTGGLYDPTVYPLVDLWGFSPRFNRSTYAPSLPYDRAYTDGQLPLPSAQHIEALLPLVGLDGIRLYQQEGVWYLEKNTPSVTLDGAMIHAQLDLGGIAKGYACDRIRDYLISSGYTMGHFICGDSSMAILSRPTADGMYNLTLGKPRPGAANAAHYASLRVRDVALSTSSDASHAYTLDGIRYCHIIDPRTGWPINMPSGSIQRGTASVTLLCASAAYGDAMSTALCLMSPREATEYISAHLSSELVIASLYRSDADTLEVITNAQADRLTLDDPAYVFASDIDDSGRMQYIGSFFSP